MCGRYTLTYSDLDAVVAELEALLDPAAAELHRPRYNIAPTNAAVIARPGPDRPALVPALWGFHRDRRLIVNARSESAATRFVAAYQHGRCVVPADGFYEWTGEQRARRPLWFHAPLIDGKPPPLFMAGLFEERGDGGGAPLTFTILTAAARPPVAAIHDRMPVLLSREGARRWLLGPPPPVLHADDVRLDARPVSARANATAHDDPACIEPAGAEPGEQLGLF